MRILIIGIGYVGLVTGTCFAEMGYQVLCLDTNQEKIKNLQQGLIPIYEPGLEEMVKRNIKEKRLSFTTDYTSAIANSQICFIAVDTPVTSTGAADISHVEQVALNLAQIMQDYLVIIIKSTVPIGTGSKISHLISHVLNEREVDIPFDVVSNPEFLKEGNAIQDFMKPDRVVIGVDNPEVISLMKDLYSPFMLNHERLLVMDVVSAELCKYAANAMLATRISFMNEMSNLCELLGARVDWVRKAMGADPRIGKDFLYPGVGYGGSCLPKDIKALIAQAKKLNYSFSILESVDAVNQKQKEMMGQKIASYFMDKGGLKNKVIGIFGLAFKPGTDDMREASSLVLIQNLLQHGALLKLFDPIAFKKAQSILGDSPLIQWCQSEQEAATEADALVLMTEWRQFRLMDFTALLACMKGTAFFDGRNQYQPEEMARRGFDYISMGRPTAYTLSYEQTTSSYALELETY